MNLIARFSHDILFKELNKKRRTHNKFFENSSSCHKIIPYTLVSDKNIAMISARKNVIEDKGTGNEMEGDKDDYGSYRSYFHEFLCQPRSLGNFVVGDYFEHCCGCGPQLSVNGVGRIGLPLSQEQAVTLISVMEQAPYGKGSETVTDLSVRDVLQLDASRVSLGKRWEKDTLSSL